MGRLLQIDRRWIFGLIFLAVLVPFLTGLRFKPGLASPSTTDVYEYVDKLPPRAVIMIAFDYGPASMPELQPMAVALCRHAFRHKLRVLCLTHNVQGVTLADRVLAKVAPETGAKYAVDYANLGFKPGYVAVIQSLGSSIPGTYSQDAKGTATATMPVMQGVHDYSDIALIFDLASSNSPGAWIAYAHEKYKVPVAIGITAVMAAESYVFYQAKQVIGMLNGLKGASEYEYLINTPDSGALGMASQSIAHVVIILFVILGNIGYFASRRKRR
jgi:hypothetical protein